MAISMDLFHCLDLVLGVIPRGVPIFCWGNQAKKERRANARSGLEFFKAALLLSLKLLL